MANDELIQAYKSIADMTGVRCGKTCSKRPPLNPNRCCSPEYCEFAIEYAKEEWGVDLHPTGHPTLLLMGEHGCIAEPHLRPMCSMHSCDIEAFGISLEGEKWTERYFELRATITELEHERREAAARCQRAAD